MKSGFDIQDSEAEKEEEEEETYKPFPANKEEGVEKFVVLQLEII
jgi:hypothetical protein